VADGLVGLEGSRIEPGEASAFSRTGPGRVAQGALVDLFTLARIEASGDDTGAVFDIVVPPDAVRLLSTLP
jgi:hypothetical protein